MLYKEQSIPLLSIDSKQNFTLTPQGRQFLLSIDKPIAIVTIAGVYRTGKSYLINKLLKSKNGFKTGGTTTSVTKGLNVWGKPLLAQKQDGEQIYYLVIDSEGIGSCEQEMKYDIKLLMLIFLISSTVLYNSLGAIDQIALDQLRVVLKLKQCFVKQSASERVKFVWVLRDFALQLIDRNGRELTANEYLENCLEEVPATSVEARKKNEIRRAIKQQLGERSCYTLIRPTLKEQDLVDLSKCKVRNQFLEQLEIINNDVFSASHSDLKQINGQIMNGRLFVMMLQKYVEAMNLDETPNVEDIWLSVAKTANEEFLEDCCKRLKEEVDILVLPMAKQQLKLKLNEIQNKLYNHFESNITNDKTFKKTYRDFLKFVQKVNRDVKRNNNELHKSKVMRETRDFVQSNLKLDLIQPTNFEPVRLLIERLQLRSKGEIQAYEYILNTVFDILHISQQKSSYVSRELEDLQRVLETGHAQRKSTDQNVMSIKQDYHSSLKKIAQLKANQQELEKDNALLKNHQQLLEMRVRTLLDECQEKDAHLARQVEQTSQRFRERMDDLGLVVKKLREENNVLTSELQEVKEQRFHSAVQDRKEVIFEEKIKETWDKFDQERNYFKGELQKQKQQTANYKLKFEQLAKTREKDKELATKLQEQFSKKQKEFMAQLKQMKNLHNETKKVYCATYETIKDSDRIFSDITNIVASNTKYSANQHSATNNRNPGDQDRDRDGGMIRKYYEMQLQKNLVDHEEQIKLVVYELKTLHKNNDMVVKKLKQTETEFKRCQKQCSELREELAMAGSKFVQSLSQIQLAKQRQRSLYQESIVRMLSNLDQRSSSSIGRPSHSSHLMK